MSGGAGARVRPEDLKDVRQCVQAPSALDDESVLTALNAIASVHRVPAMPPIPLELLPTLQNESEGVYVCRSDGMPLQIRIRADARQVALTTAHEVGHYLHHQGIEPAGVWTSEHDPLLRTLRDAWERSEAVRTLRRGAEDGRLPLAFPGTAAVEVALTPTERAHCAYYLEGRELFARSYAQFIAVTSRDRVLLNEVGERRDSPEGRIYRVQWADSDFRLIAGAFDRLLRRLGWRI